MDMNEFSTLWADRLGKTFVDSRYPQCIFRCTYVFMRFSELLKEGDFSVCAAMLHAVPDKDAEFLMSSEHLVENVVWDDGATPVVSVQCGRKEEGRGCLGNTAVAPGIDSIG